MNDIGSRPAHPVAPPSCPAGRRQRALAVCPDDAARSGVWADLRREAAALIAREPALRPLLEATVLRPDTPAQVLAAVIVRRLGTPAPGLRRVLGEALTQDRSLPDAAAADLQALLQRDPACRSALQALLHAKGFHALQVHRAAHSLWQRGRPEAAQWLAGQLAAALGVDIHPAAPFGQRVVLDHATGLVVGETAVVEDDVTLFHHVTLGATGATRGDRHPKVRRGALLGAGATVLGNVEIGCMSRVAAGSVVLAAVPAHATVVGIPARVVRRRAAAPLERVA